MNEIPRAKRRTGKRVPLTSVSFSDSRGEIAGFANGWYFWLHKGFREALDIRFVERIDRDKTAAFRNKLSLEQTNLSLDELRSRKKESTAYSKAYEKIMKRSIKFLLETESTLPVVNFKPTDSFESRCGTWHIRVTSQDSEMFEGEGDNTQIRYNVLGLNIYRRSPEPDATWESHSTANLQQFELVELLKSGKTRSVDFLSEGSTGDTSGQLHLL
jgi:hypothetical protein